MARRSVLRSGVEGRRPRRDTVYRMDRFRRLGCASKRRHKVGWRVIHNPPEFIKSVGTSPADPAHSPSNCFGAPGANSAADPILVPAAESAGKQTSTRWLELPARSRIDRCSSQRPLPGDHAKREIPALLRRYSATLSRPEQTKPSKATSPAQRVQLRLLKPQLPVSPFR